ncbi:MAG TPA: glycosyl transferase family 2 [Terrisporobacter glycolicus]|uniref:glycosyltransferase family 2 protein n=1 Tax=Terrisporobacter TaxID=1505652 RepID=UPI000E8939C3|nr:MULTISPECIES: glycosyltransferase [Terrisporobacter]HBI93586.1 glycosyl transferase family 2 [Terrisporobacter hibernicus]
MAKVSIIIPIYNVEKYLCKCIESILAQTHKNLELILVDDGSPDNSPKICDEYAQKDDRVIVIHKPNGGVSSARNAGLDRASGEYIGFIDPDDYIRSDMYELMVDELERNNVNMAICGYDYITENGKVERPYNIRGNELLTQKQFMTMQFDMPPTVRHGVVNKLFTTSTFNGIRFPEGLHSSEDVYVLTECAKKINKVVFIHQPLYKNLMRNGSATHGGLNIEDLAASFNIHEKMHIESISLYPELKSHSLEFLMDVCLLKYNEAKQKSTMLDSEQNEHAKKHLKYMRRFIKKHAISAMLCKNIYWKTRITYLIC